MYSFYHSIWKYARQVSIYSWENYQPCVEGKEFVGFQNSINTYSWYTRRSTYMLIDYLLSICELSKPSSSTTSFLTRLKTFNISFFFNFIVTRTYLHSNLIYMEKCLFLMTNINILWYPIVDFWKNILDFSFQCLIYHYSNSILEIFSLFWNNNHFTNYIFDKVL